MTNLTPRGPERRSGVERRVADIGPAVLGERDRRSGEDRRSGKDRRRHNRDERGDSIATDVRDLLLVLAGDPNIDASTLGDRILLEHGYADVPLREVASLFGQQFAAAVVDLEPGVWSGPIQSGYGVHLVFVDGRIEARLPELDEIRDQVRREWDNARRVDAIETFYREMLDRYEVVIEWPESGTEEGES